MQAETEWGEGRVSQGSSRRSLVPRSGGPAPNVRALLCPRRIETRPAERDSGTCIRHDPCARSARPHRASALEIRKGSLHELGRQTRNLISSACRIFHNSLFGTLFPMRTCKGCLPRTSEKFHGRVLHSELPHSMRLIARICCTTMLLLAWSLSSPTFRLRTAGRALAHHALGRGRTGSNAMSEVTPLKYAPSMTRRWLHPGRNPAPGEWSPLIPTSPLSLFPWHPFHPAPLWASGNGALLSRGAPCSWEDWTDD